MGTPRFGRGIAAAALVAALLSVAPNAASPAGAQEAPDGSRSSITQDLVARQPLPGGGWQLTIEATLDSNAICHVLLFQCVVQPELAPANLTLQSVECLSPGWHQIQITLPFFGTVVDVCARFDANRAGLDQKFRFVYTTPLDVGTVSETVSFFRFPEEFFFVRAQDTIQIQITVPFFGTVVDVCARFDANRAGLDQKFRFVYTTPLDVGTVSETVRFFRFPEEFFFVRAQDTIQIDLAAEADVFEECPDSAVIGTSIPCTVRVEVLSNVPNASVTRTPPAQFTNATLAPDANPGDWDCTAVTMCTYLAGGGTLPPGIYTFTAAADVVGPAGDVDDCSEVATGGTMIGSDCDSVRVRAADVDTFVEVEKTAPISEVDPGSPVTFTIVVANQGPNPAQDVRVFETPSPLLENASIRLASGDGAWVCSQGATLECTAPTLAVNGSATFEVTGVVSPSAPGGSAILNEVTVVYANDPFGPEFPVRDGTLVHVRGAVAIPAVATPTFTG